MTKKKNTLEINPRLLPSLGYLETKLPPDILKFLGDAIKNKDKERHNSKLATDDYHLYHGHFGNSYLISDKNDWFFNNVIQGMINTYHRHFGGCAQQYLTVDCKYVLRSMWVNYQRKHQFNPLHDHTGIFSFVIWYKIPPSSFEFLYTDIIGRIQSKKFSLSSKDEGNMLLFPSTLKHQVSPFYTSNEDRMSIAGNVLVDAEQIVK